MADSCSALRVAVAVRFWDDADSEVREAVNAAVAVLGRQTASLQEVDLSTEVDRTVVRCEPYVYHQRYLPAHEGEYQPETVKRIRSGADVTAADYVHHYRDLLRARREIVELFSKIDVIVTPTSPALPPKIADLEDNPELRSKELFMLRNTRPFNVWGLPTISIPCGFSKSGLPIGLQIAGAPGAEGTVLALARAYEQQTDWHRKKPTLGSE